MSEVPGQSLLRRNGKPQSCEPCRKSKLGCDHALPKCGRCLQRRIQHRCIYHPAPLTKKIDVSENIERTHSPNVQTIAGVGKDPIEWIGPELHIHVPTPDAERIAGDEHLYLGPTSYSAVFHENDLGPTCEDFSEQTAPTIHSEYGLAKPVNRGKCNLESHEHVNQGIRILQRFPDKTLCNRLLERYFDVCDVLLPEPLIYHLTESIWTTYGSYLKEPRQNDQLSKISRELCATAMIPLSTASSTEEWIESVSGRRLRWEMLGNLFSIFGLSVMTMLDWDPLFAATDNNNPYNRREYGAKMRECTEACLALCNDVDAVNEFVVTSMASAYVLQSVYEGDASKSTNSLPNAFFVKSLQANNSGEDMAA